MDAESRPTPAGEDGIAVETPNPRESVALRLDRIARHLKAKAEIPWNPLLLMIREQAERMAERVRRSGGSLSWSQWEPSDVDGGAPSSSACLAKAREAHALADSLMQMPSDWELVRELAEILEDLGDAFSDERLAKGPESELRIRRQEG